MADTSLIVNAQDRIAHLERALLELKKAAQNFVYKCDHGQAHSVHSYKEFKDALALADNPNCH
jgi:hypothetical protein